MIRRAFVSRACWLAVGLYQSVGLAWTVSNLGDIPHYGDTFQYMRLARRLEVPENRGPLYPLLLAATDRACSNEELPRHLGWKEEEAAENPRPCASPPELVCLEASKPSSPETMPNVAVPESMHTAAASITAAAINGLLIPDIGSSSKSYTAVRAPGVVLAYGSLALGALQALVQFHPAVGACYGVQ